MAELLLEARRGPAFKALTCDGKEDHTASLGPFIFLSQGQKSDLRNRKVLPDTRKRAATAVSAGDKQSKP